MAVTAVSASSGSIMGFLDLLGKLGGNLPAFMTFFQTMIQAWTALQAAISPGGQPVKLMASTLTAEEAAAVNKLHLSFKPALLALPDNPAGHHLMVLGDGGIFARMFAFAKAHPVLMEILERAAQKLITGGL